MAPTNNENGSRHVISLGGSLLYEGAVLDLQFLKNLQTLLRARVAVGDQFIIIVGGGYVSRQYQKALRELGAVDVDLDWVGIHACRLNAQLLRLLLKDISHPDILLTHEALAKAAEPIVFAGGFLPGGSSDHVSVELAKAGGAQSIINMTNTSYVYDKDPALYPDAVAFEDLTWEAFAELIPKHWSPGLHTPFDPEAAAEAHRSGIEVAIIGKDITNLATLLNGGVYIGTKLHA